MKITTSTNFHSYLVLLLCFAVCSGCVEKKEIEISQLQMLADRGNPHAQRELGLLYLKGTSPGFEMNELTAFSWLSKAADNHDVEAEYWVGRMYFFGSGVDQSTNDALKHFQRAADKGSAPAQNFIGMKYLHGWGGERDLARAESWFYKAARHGLANAQFNLGQLYPKFHKRHPGISLDAASSMYWLNRSANQGYEPAQRMLLQILLEGQMGQTNFVDAYKWATILSDEEARLLIKSKLDPANLKKAHGQAEKFQPKIETSQSYAWDWAIGIILIIQAAAVLFLHSKKMWPFHNPIKPV